jgi:hypothetical protein
MLILRISGADMSRYTRSAAMEWCVNHREKSTDSMEDNNIFFSMAFIVTVGGMLTVIIEYFPA